MGPRLIDVLKYSGPISIADLSDRVAASVPELVSELEGLEREGLVSISGPRGEANANANERTVELSGRGLKYIMA